MSRDTILNWTILFGRFTCNRNFYIMDNFATNYICPTVIMKSLPLIWAWKSLVNDYAAHSMPEVYIRNCCKNAVFAPQYGCRKITDLQNVIVHYLPEMELVFVFPLCYGCYIQFNNLLEKFQWCCSCSTYHRLFLYDAILFRICLFDFCMVFRSYLVIPAGLILSCYVICVSLLSLRFYCGRKLSFCMFIIYSDVAWF